MAVNWVDRVPTRANRVLVTPENGGTPYYATITRADEPSVVGTPVNAANLNAMQNAAGLTANKNYYVATTGSDTTGTGSQASPYATINYALSRLPKNLNGFTAIIHIAAGSYPESVAIRDFGNGILRFTGTAGDVVEVSGLTFTNVKYAEITNITFSITNSNLYAFSSSIRIESPLIASGGAHGVYANHSSFLAFMNNVTVTNVTDSGVTSTNCSSVYVENLLGDNSIAFVASRGGICSFFTNESTSSRAKYFVEKGGRIFSGAQSSMPNY
jgi:hypothetical protein